MSKRNRVLAAALSLILACEPQPPETLDECLAAHVAEDRCSALAACWHLGPDAVGTLCDQEQCACP